MERPKFPKTGGISTTKLSPEEIEGGKRMLAEGNSERFVAAALGVSRHTMKMHCKEGFREWYNDNHKRKWRQDTTKKTAAAVRRYHKAALEKPAELASFLAEKYRYDVETKGLVHLAAVQRERRKKLTDDHE